MSRQEYGRAIGEVARSLGYVFDGKTRGGHLKWRLPSGRLVITGADLRAARGFHNAVAQLRQSLRLERSENSG